MRRDMDAKLHRWAEWVAGHMDQSAIGYPRRTVEAQLMDGTGGSGGPPGSISPEVIMPPWIAMTDKVIRGMPKRWRALIDMHYNNNRRLSRQQYREMDRIHYYMLGRFDGISA